MMRRVIAIAGAFAAACLVLAAPNAQAELVSATPHSTKVTAANQFYDLKSDTYQAFLKESHEHLMFMYFSSKNCGACPVMEKGIKDYIAKKGGTYRVGKAMLPDMKAQADEFNIVIIPALIAFKDGKEIGRRVGYSIDQGPKIYPLWVEKMLADWKKPPPPITKLPNPLPAASKPYNVKVTSKNVESIVAESKKRVVILAFGHEDNDKFFKTLRTYADNDKGVWRLGEVNLQKEPSMRQRFFVEAGPTFIALRDGRAISTDGGWLNDKELRAWVDRALKAGQG